MNRFRIVSCIEPDNKKIDYDGPIVVLACVADPNIVLFFPVSMTSANIISEIINDNDLDPDEGVLGIYKTMLDSWRASDRYLSGVVLDSVYDEDSEEQVLFIRLAIIDNQGGLDSLVKVNCIHALILAALVGVDVLVSDSLLAKVLPDMFGDQEDDDEEEQEENSVYPRDKELLNLVQKIMQGPIKEDEGPDRPDRPGQPE